MKIKSVSLDFPNSEKGEQLYYEVGKVSIGGKISKPVTTIEKRLYRGQECWPPYCRIYTEDGLIAEMHQFGHIRYFEKHEEATNE
uniref:Uncharacterized protein n=1 Tax=viral metagenome TaxID=1070528 RepID=A0A6H1ZY87_9ZZZZ